MYKKGLDHTRFNPFLYVNITLIGVIKESRVIH